MISEVHRQIAQAALSGDHVDDIEQRIIEPEPISEEEKAALWLYAQALVERPRDRRDLALIGA